MPTNAVALVPCACSHGLPEVLTGASVDKCSRHIPELHMMYPDMISKKAKLMFRAIFSNDLVIVPRKRLSRLQVKEYLELLFGFSPVCVPPEGDVHRDAVH